MILYYYTGSEHLRDILQGQRIKVSRYMDLNDPFELAPYNISNAEFRRAHRKIIGRFAESMGLICLTKRWNSPVMWAHYARNHAGACLGIEVTYDHRFEVNYKEDKLFKGINLQNHKNFLNRDNIKKIFGTKSKDWSYEEEVRFHVPLNNEKVIKEGGAYFLPFKLKEGNTFLLKSVRVGYRCGVGISNLKQDLEKFPHPVDVIQTRPAFGKFEVVEQNDKKYWNMEEGPVDSLPAVKALWGDDLP